MNPEARDTPSLRDGAGALAAETDLRERSPVTERLRRLCLGAFAPGGELLPVVRIREIERDH